MTSGSGPIGILGRTHCDSLANTSQHRSTSRCHPQQYNQFRCALPIFCLFFGLIALCCCATNPFSFHTIYDADGNRIAKTVGVKDNLGNFIPNQSTTTSYLIDTNSLTGYAQIVDEITQANGGAPSVTRQYSYGLDLISQRQKINGNWQVNYFGYDGHGSVRFLTDTNGNVTDSFDY